MTRCAAAGEARHREIEAAPEKMHRARLAEEAGAELLEHPICVDQDLEEATCRVRIVGSMLAVLREPHRVGQLVGHIVDGDVDAEFGECSHDGGIKARDRMPGERKLPLPAVASGNAQDMIDEVEVDLERPVAVGDRRGRQPARTDV
jgi:hypothetical protein